MYRRVSLRPVITEGNFATPKAVEPSNQPVEESLRSDKKFVFIHGFNVSETEARGWGAEIFKRMYWSGSKAAFYAVTWQGNSGQFSLPVIGTKSPYHGNVLNAFKTSKVFKEFLNSLGGNVILAAHSLGNMVSSAAVAVHNADVEKYFMIDAAVAIEAYDRDEPPKIHMVHPDWDGPDVVNTTGLPENLQVEGWPGYEFRLFCTEWYKLFANTPEDSRCRLTWRGLFQNNLDRFYNFYSGGEEVLAKPLHEHAPAAADFFNGDLMIWGYRSWGAQEKGKGKVLLLSSVGGWGFSSNRELYYNETCVESGDNTPPSCTDSKKDPDEVNGTVSGEQLRTEPFFDKGSHDELFSPESGSDFVKPQWPMDNKDELWIYQEYLAGFVPALTYAAGQGEVANLKTVDTSNSRNFNMQTEDFQNGWPAERTEDENEWRRGWLHSDIKDVAYSYIYKLFDKFTCLGEGICHEGN